nr:hypothetical protein [Haloprofundus salinisoli]
MIECGQHLLDILVARRVVLSARDHHGEVVEENGSLLLYEVCKDDSTTRMAHRLCDERLK